MGNIDDKWLGKEVISKEIWMTDSLIPIGIVHRLLPMCNVWNFKCLL